jgi:hypothetical protein
MKASAGIGPCQICPALSSGQRALLGPVLEQRGGHKMILPSLTVLSHGMVIGRATFR